MSRHCERDRITPEMIRAGVAAFRRWNPDEEEIEAVVAAIFFSIDDAKRKLIEPLDADA